MYTRSRSLVIAPLFVSLAGCVLDMTELDGEADRADVQPSEKAFPPIDLCASAAADATLFVTAATPDVTLSSTSGSGSYFYSKPFPACARWVVDVKVATGALPGHELRLSGRAFDLPSSAGHGARLPRAQHDCGRWREYVSIYRRLAAEPAFTKVQHAAFEGTWTAEDCIPTLVAGTEWPYVVSAAPATGWDTYRIVVGTKLRSTWQEVVAQAEKAAVLR